MTELQGSGGAIVILIKRSDVIVELMPAEELKCPVDVLVCSTASLNMRKSIKSPPQTRIQSAD